MSFRRRTFGEIFDNLTTRIAGGEASESHPFPPPDDTGGPYAYSLEKAPVGHIESVHGTLDGKPHMFVKDTDYVLANAKTLTWLPKATVPDMGTVFDVNYYPESSTPVLTDFHTGSVIRTLTESMSMEIARLYAQLEVVYRSGFIDTATDRALDNVVALLGIDRVEGGHPVGEVEFKRVQGSRGIVSIPAGTRIITADGNVEYETTQAATLADGQSTLRVTVRDLERNDILAADMLTVLPVPIAGISSVTNPTPTSITTNDETDIELRTRAKNFLHGSERATLGAIKAAIAKQGITADIEESFDDDSLESNFDGTVLKQGVVADIEEIGIGRVKITPHADSMPPELEMRLWAAIRDSRPAGVKVTLEGAKQPASIDLGMRIITDSSLLEEDLRSLQRELKTHISDYFKRLPIGENGSINKLIGIALGISSVEDVRILNANWTVNGFTSDILDRNSGLLLISGQPTVLGSLNIADANLPTRLSVVVTYPSTIPNVDQITELLSNYISGVNTQNSTEPVPSGTPQSLSYNGLKGVVEPGLPMDGDVTIGDYNLTFTLIQATSAAILLEKDGDPSYTLTPYEQLSLEGIQVVQEDV